MKFWNIPKDLREQEQGMFSVGSWVILEYREDTWNGFLSQDISFI